MSANNLTLSDSGDCLYFTSTRRSMDNPSVAYPVIYKYNLSDKSGEEVCEFPDYKSVSNLKIVGDTLYFIAVDRKKAEEGAYVNTVEWYYSYGGEVMNSYNLKTGELSQIAVDFPVSFYADGDTLRIFVYNNSGKKRIRRFACYLIFRNCTGLYHLLHSDQKSGCNCFRSFSGHRNCNRCIVDCQQLPGSGDRRTFWKKNTSRFNWL